MSARIVSGKFYVLWSFQLKPGVIAERGTTITLSDPDVIDALLAAVKIEPADPETKARIAQLEIKHWIPIDPGRWRADYKTLDW
jgi:hypothetical protein